MMIDTHVCVWLSTSSPRLGRQASRMIAVANRNADVCFSAISIWEIGMLLQKRRLVPGQTAAQFRQNLLERGFREIPVDGVIAARAGSLPNLHGDPADRIIVATALAGHQLITDDRLILNWPGRFDRFPARR